MPRGVFRTIRLCLPLLLTPLVGACGERERPSSRPPQSASASSGPAARLIFLTDLEGYLEPCGCQSTSLGGIDRAAAQIETLAKSKVPTAIVATGDLLFQPGGEHQRRDEDARIQELWKAETIVKVLSRLPLTAALSGEGDLQFGEDALKHAASEAKFPWFGSVTGTPNKVATKRMQVGSLEVGLALRAATASEDGRALGAELTQAAKALRSEACQFVVAALDGDGRQARQAAASTQGVDVLVATGRDRDDPSAPELVGETLLVSGGRHGRGLLVVEPTLLEPGKSFVNVSAWSRQAERQAKQATIDDLKSRIAVWEQDKDVDQVQLATQRARLAKLEKELTEDTKPTAEGNRVDVRYVPLPQSLPQAPQVSALMAEYDARVNEHNRTAFADRVPQPAAPGQAGYVGSEVCKNCHAPAFAWWQGHPHGRAYDTLVEKHKEFNLSCVGCHLTGYEQPGGSTVTHNEHLRHVGCESCHGPGSLHLADHKHIVRSPKEATCKSCHNAEHSDQFEFATYRKRLLAPGHGMPGTPAKESAP